MCQLISPGILQVPGEQFNGLISQFSTPPKPVPALTPISQPQGPFSTQTSFNLVNPPRAGLTEQFAISPSSFLTMPPGHDKSQEPQIESSMEIGTPQISNFAMKPEPSGDEASSMQTCSHDQQMFNSGVGMFQSQHTPTATPTPPPLNQDFGINTGASMNSGTITSPQDTIFNPMPTTTPMGMGSVSMDTKQPPEPPMSSLQLLNQLFANETPRSAIRPVPSPSPPMGGTPLSHTSPTSGGPLTPHGSSIFEFPGSSPQQQQRQMFETQSLSQTSSSSSPSLQVRMDMPPPSHNPFLRVSSAGNLGAVSESPRPPLERGQSEPTRYLEQKLSELTEVGQRQMKEIEKQQGLAHMQYTEILQQYLRKTSEQQQQVLQSVLADPSLISILRNVLLQGPTPASDSSPSTATAAVGLTQDAQGPGKLGISFATPTRTMAEDDSASPLTLSHLVSPTQLAKVWSVCLDTILGGGGGGGGDRS